MKDTFWSIDYKGHYIHGHHDRDLGREVITAQLMRKDGSFRIYEAKSLQAAKVKITRFLRHQTITEVKHEITTV